MTLRAADQSCRDDGRCRAVAEADVHLVSSGELDRRIGAGAEEWLELQDELLATGGMLPHRVLMARLVRFLDGVYLEAEGARVEALRRQRVFDGMGRRERSDAGWELV